jgi:hypothetical protein
MGRILRSAVVLVCAFFAPVLQSERVASSEAKPLAATVADIVASEATFLVTPENVVESFVSLAPLAPRPPGHAQEFLGRNQDLGVRWVRVQFLQEESPRTWQLSQVDVVLLPVDAEGSDTYQAILREMSRRLGQPSKPAPDDPNRRVAWFLGPDRETALLLAVLDDPDTNRPYPSVLVEMLVAQGEPEDE